MFIQVLAAVVHALKVVGGPIHQDKTACLVLVPRAGKVAAPGLGC